MKSIKYLVLLICMTLGMANVAKAQIYSNEICFYLTSDGPNVDYVRVVKFEGSKNRILKKSIKKKRLIEFLTKSVDFFENDRIWEVSLRDESIGGISVIWNYDYELSTSSREVYTGISNSEYYSLYGTKWNIDHTKQKMAFSKDKSSLIEFNLYHPETSKIYYIRVDKEDLLPKAINPNELDFLNE